MAAANPIPSELAFVPSHSVQFSVSDLLHACRTNQAKSNLIDLDLDSQPAAAGTGNVTDDLMGLFGGPDLSTPSVSTPSVQPQKQAISAAALSSLYNTPTNQRPMASPLIGQSMHSNSPSLSASQFGSIALPNTPGGSYSGTPGRGGGTPLGWNGGSAAPAQQQQQLFGGIMTPSNNLSGSQSTSATQQSRPPQQPAGKDPFADLAGLF